MERQLSIPHSVILGSAFDCLDLSIYGVTLLAEGMGRVPDNWRQFLLGDSAVAVYAASAGVFFLALVLRWALFFIGRKPRIHDRSKNRLDWILEPAAWPQTGWCRGVRIVVTSLSLGVAGLVAQAALLFVMLASVCLVILGLSIVLMIGQGAGTKYLVDFVIRPSDCAPLVSRVTRLSCLPADLAPRALCAVLCKDSKSLGQGRVALATTSAILLYNPDDGRTARIPIEGVVIKPIEKLEGDMSRQCDEHFVGGLSASVADRP
jgi:hypothetical protein